MINMNPIMYRQSVRKFTDEDVSPQLIENLLRAAMQAPSACNQQAWEFIVIGDEEDKLAISKMHKFAKPAAEASKLIVVLGNLKRAKIESMIEQDLAACCENIMLQATYYSAGAVWLGFHPIEDRCNKIREYLNIPDYCIPFAVICVGYSEVDREIQIRYDESKIHYDRY